MKRIALILTAMLLLASHGISQIISVPGDQPSIQAAINAATDGDTVVVEEDTYYENINFKGKAIAVASRFILDGDTSHISKTIIDGSNLAATDTCSVVTMWSGEDTTSVICGFTITGGKGTLMHLADEWDAYSGAAVLIFGNGGKVCNNIIEENHADNRETTEWIGGGILLMHVVNNHTAILRKNVIRNNYCTGHDIDGGIIFLNGGRIIVDANTIENNVTSGVNTWGATIMTHNFGTTGVIKERIISNNTISGNIGSGSDWKCDGGGILAGVSFVDGTEHIFNNVISHNITDGKGGGIASYFNLVTIFSNTIYDNIAGLGGNDLYMDEGSVILFNNILGSSEDRIGSSMLFKDKKIINLDAYYNLLPEPLESEFNITSVGNYMAKPEFDSGSFNLAPYSPGIGMGKDTVIIKGISYTAPTRDFYGNPRPDLIDGKVDMGAVESPYEGQVYIPDTAFLYALIEEGVDTNGDSLISYGEAEVVKSLNISAFDWDMEYISDMTGIEAFIELEVLECDGHNLTSLNISNNTELWYLSVSRNQLTNLDVSSNTKLEALSCSNNQLTTLDVSNNTNLSGTDWGCYGCQKSSNLIPWFGYPGLDCSNNLLTSLDVSNNTKLKALACDNNQLTSLNVSGCDSLAYLRCQGNQLTDLDISNNTGLEYLDCSRMQLTNLDISNNMDIEELWIGENPSLYEVCVWEDFSLDSILVDRIGSQKVCFQTDCNGDCSTGITITIKIDTMYQPVNIEVQSSQNGMIYLVPENTDQVIEVIREACIDSFEVVVNTPVFIPQEGIENGTYWLYGTDNSGNISEPKAYTIMGVGIDNQNAENLRIFPNPTYTKLTIVMSMIDRFNVNITSLNGQLILSKEMEGTSNQLDLSPFQKGVYFITIRSKDFVTTRKIVKL